MRLESRLVLKTSSCFSFRLDKAKKDLASAERNANLYESRFNDITIKYNQALVEKKKALDDVKVH